MRTVTLTFDLATRLLFATHRLVMMITCVKLFLNPVMHNKLWVGNEQVPLKSMHKVLVRTVTLTIDLAIWFLFATHCLDIIITCAKLFLNPAMHNKLWVGNEQVPLKFMHKV